MSQTIPAPKSFVIAMKDFFGLQPGQNASGFLTEIKALSDDDRAYFRQHLIAAGINVAPPTSA